MTHRPGGIGGYTRRTVLLSIGAAAVLIGHAAWSAEEARSAVRPTPAGVSFRRDALGATIPGGAKWIGGVTGVDGCIYGIPHFHPSILIIDPAKQAATVTDLGVDLAVPTESPGGRWSTGALGEDGKIYCVPRSANTILVIDTNAQEAALTTMGAALRGAQKWMGGVRGLNGKIYGIPMDSPDVLVIDPASGSATRTDMGADFSGRSKWSGGVLASNGKIYCIPRTAKDILIIDPKTDTATRTSMGLEEEAFQNWRGGVLGPDGKIYGVPRRSSTILIIDPETETATTSNMGATLGTDLEAEASWRGGVLAQDGKIYCIPRDATRGVLVIDPASNRAEVVAANVDLSGPNKWSGGGVLGVDGRIYAIPYVAPDLLLMNVPGSPLNLDTLLSPHRNGL